MIQEKIRHVLICPFRSRWRRARFDQPFWREDKTAQALGIASFGCRRCGRGAIHAHLGWPLP